MFTITGERQKYCDGVNRRNFLQLGAFGLGLSLADLLRAQAATRETPNADLSAKTNGTRQKSAIMIYLPGGPSHMDMYDLKPEAPAEFRGEFKPINTNVSGIQISEHFPLQAKMFDKLSVIRSLVAVDEHSDSQVMTGYSENTNRTAHHPSFGSVVSKLRPGTNEIPPFVSLRGMSVGCEPGFLGVANRAFTPDGPGLENLKMRGGFTSGRMDDRKELLERIQSLEAMVAVEG